MRKAFTGHAAFLVHDIIAMPRGAAVSRYVIILTAFLISGAMHAIIPPVSLSCHGVWQVAYYCCVGATIALENVVQQIYRHYQTPLDGKGVERNAYWRTAGYMWVTFFHLWTTSKFAYPPIVCETL